MISGHSLHDAHTLCVHVYGMRCFMWRVPSTCLQSTHAVRGVMSSAVAITLVHNTSRLDWSRLHTHVHPNLHGKLLNMMLLMCDVVAVG